MSQRRPKKKKPKISSSITGMSGVFFVSYELSKRGMIVLPTNRNTKGFDLISTDKSGSNLKIFQVKTKRIRSRFWIIGGDVPDYMANNSNAFYVFIQPEKEGQHYEVFILPAKEIRKFIEERKKRWGRKPEPNGLKPDVWVYGWELPSEERKKEEIRRRYLNKWELITR